jgi:hypothetical protein
VVQNLRRTLRSNPAQTQQQHIAGQLEISAITLKTPIAAWSANLRYGLIS